MYAVVVRFDKKTNQVYALNISDDLQSVNEGMQMPIDELARLIVSNPSLKPLNFSIDRNSQLVQDVGLFERLMPIDKSYISNPSDTVCSNVILSEIQDNLGNVLGYRLINSDTFFISNIHLQDILDMAKNLNRPIFQNGIIRNGAVCCYPNHPFNVSLFKNFEEKKKNEIKTANPTHAGLEKQSKPAKKHSHSKQEKPTPNMQISSYNEDQKKELARAKKAGVDVSLIANPDLSNKQMRIIWSAQRDGFNAAAITDPKLPVESMRFYANMIVSDEDAKVYKPMMKHPELTMDQIEELNTCILFDIPYEDLIGLPASKIAEERQLRLCNRELDAYSVAELAFGLEEDAINSMTRNAGFDFA